MNEKFGFNRMSFNVIIEAEDYEPEIVQNYITLVFDSDVVPLEYVGEQHAYSQSPWSPCQGFYPNAWLVDRMQNLYFAGDDGYVYSYGVGDSDAGQLISAYYITPPIDLDVPDRKKRVRWIDLDLKAYPGTHLKVFYRKDDDTEWKLLSEVEQKESYHPFVKMYDRPLFRKIQLKFENVDGQKFVLNSFALDMAVRAQRRELV